MISHLPVNEIDRIEEIGHSFAQETKYPGGFHLEAFKATWLPTIQSGLGEILVYKDGEKIVGAFGMVVLPDTFSGHRVAAETFWYVLPSHRATRAGVELFYRFEALGKARGAKRLVMVHLANLTPQKLREFYEKNGYELVEQTFWKELK